VRVGVVGAGTMGAGIAQTFAMHGYDVTMVDVADAQLERGRSAISASLAKLQEKGKLSAPAAEIVGRIRSGTDIGALADADLVVEAAYEDPQTKRDLFAMLDLTRKDVILLNTSSIHRDARRSNVAAGPRRGHAPMNPVPSWPWSRSCEPSTPRGHDRHDPRPRAPWKTW
jgi:3-hydroxybutyryl-CoA dehydrogenase